MTNALQNILVTSVDITIKDKTYKMVFDFNAVAEVEQMTSRNLMTKEGWDDLNGREVSILFWSTLQAEQPDITLQQVRKLMNTRNIKLITDKVMEAWTLSKVEETADPTPGLTVPAPAAQ